jgi:SAM-dependent methyltransferase
MRKKLRLAARALREAPSLIETARMAAIAQLKTEAAECPVCGFTGKFRSFGEPSRPGVLCPACGSLERHRLLALAVQKGLVSFDGKNILHFAAEATTRRLTTTARCYKTSSYPDRGTANYNFNIESIDLPAESYDIIICSHVLEHVDDRKALKELHRILSPGGTLVVMVPIIEGWERTYENENVVTERDRHIHFGQFDHVRFYGADVRQRIRDAGFELSEFTSGPVDAIRYGLQRGEKVFIASKDV